MYKSKLAQWPTSGLRTKWTQSHPEPQRNCFMFWDITEYSRVEGRSQWLRGRGLRHEPSSPPPTLRPWVRIPLETLMFVCVYSVFVLSSVWVAALQRADPPSKESYRLCVLD
jgi:hypothetical protein